MTLAAPRRLLHAGLLLAALGVLGGRVGTADAQVAAGNAPSAGADDATLERETPTMATSGRALLAGPVDAKNYRLGPGDVLSLELTGRASRIVPLVVDVEGRVNVPEIGVIAVAGRTLDNVRTELLGRLRPIYPGARVDLRLLQIRNFKVYVSGQVNSPGAASATHTARASEILRGSFALLPGASRRNIELHRLHGETRRVDLDEFALLGRAEANPMLEDGDILVVPPARERVFALGAFARPGDFELASGDSVSDLVALAGGLLPGATQVRGSLVRFVTTTQTDSLPVDLAAVTAGSWNLPLQAQDRLFAHVPSDFLRPRNITVFGEVRLPGPYAIHPGTDRLSTILARCGGLTPDAARRRILVFRPGAPSTQRDIEFERLSRLTRSEMSDAEYTLFQTKLASQQAAYIVSQDELTGSNPAFDVILEEGDVIVVDRETEAVRVAGEVKRPALVAFERNRSGADYIALAGGFTRRARRGDVRVTRPGSNQTLSLADVNEIQPGDFIWVPEKKEVNVWGVIKDVILVAGSAATVVILVRNTAH